MIVRFHVPGLPQGKGRARAATVGGRARLYTPAKTVAYEGLIGLYAGEAMDGRDLIDGPIHVVATATFPIPKSWTKKRRAEAAGGNAWHISKPDGDNILKALGDGCNGIVWTDDSRVAIAKMVKVYGDKPGLDVLVEGLGQ